MVKTEEVIISSNATTSQFTLAHNSFFYFSIGIIPILVFALTKIVKTDSVKYIAVITGIIILSGLTLWLIRVQMLISDFEKLTRINNLISEEIVSEYSVENLLFGKFLALGILIGFIPSYAYLKIVNKKNMKTNADE